MKKIGLILAFLFLLSIESYAQDIDVRGGLLIAVGPAPGETVKAVAALVITDSTGNRAGLDISTGKILQEIPNASCGIERIDDLVTGEPGAEGWRLDSVAPSEYASQ